MTPPATKLDAEATAKLKKAGLLLAILVGAVALLVLLNSIGSKGEPVAEPEPTAPSITSGATAPPAPVETPKEEEEPLPQEAKEPTPVESLAALGIEGVKAPKKIDWSNVEEVERGFDAIRKGLEYLAINDPKRDSKETRAALQSLFIVEGPDLIDGTGYTHELGEIWAGIDITKEEKRRWGSDFVIEAENHAADEEAGTITSIIDAQFIYSRVNDHGKTNTHRIRNQVVLTAKPVDKTWKIIKIEFPNSKK